MSAKAVEDVFAHESLIGQEFDLESGPLWRVALYETGVDSQNGGCFIALTISHIITDGSGVLELFRRIVQNPRNNSPIKKSIGLAPRAEDTMNLWPAFIPAAKSLFQEIFIQTVHTLLRAYVRKIPFWPTPSSILAKPVQCKTRRTFLDFEDDKDSMVSGLKRFDVVTGCGTLHSLIPTANLIALLAAIENSRHAGALLNEEPFAITNETPIAFRSEKDDHPPPTGNYTGVGEFSSLASKLKTPIIRDLSTIYGNRIHSPEGRQEALRRTGMLRLIPDFPSIIPKNSNTFKIEGSKVTPCPTGWESFLLIQADSPAPYRSSFAASNLGLLSPSSIADTVVQSMSGLWFAQSPMPCGSAIYLDVVSCKSNDDANSPEGKSQLGIAISWLDGVFDDKFMPYFVRALTDILRTFSTSCIESGDAANILSDIHVDFCRTCNT